MKRFRTIFLLAFLSAVFCVGQAATEVQPEADLQPGKERLPISNSLEEFTPKTSKSRGQQDNKGKSNQSPDQAFSEAGAKQHKGTQDETEPEVFTLRIEVFDAVDDQSLQGAEVKVTSIGTGAKFERDRRTKNNGTVTIEGVPRGRIELLVVKKDFETYLEEHDVSVSSSVGVSLVRND
jgi:hypothetical protein